MKMRIEEKLVLELCRIQKDADNIEKFGSAPAFNWDYFFTILDKHMILPIALNELIKYNLPSRTKKILSLATKNAVVGTALLNSMIKDELLKIKSVFTLEGIDFILMKGLSLDFNGLRTIGDLDILVRYKDLPAADMIIRNSGYYYVGDKINRFIKKNEKKNISLQLDWNNQYQYKNQKNMLLLELHTNLFERERAYELFDLNNIWDSIELIWDNRIQDKTLNCYFFSTEDQLILMCLHTAIKRSLYSNTFILRNLLDINNLIEREIDWNRFLLRIQQMNISSLILFSLTLTSRLTGSRIPETIHNELKLSSTKSERFLVQLHLKCFHNFESSGMFYSNIYKIISPFIYQKRILPRIKAIMLFPVFFPPRTRMAQLYNISENNPLIFLTYFVNPVRNFIKMVKQLFN